MTEGSEPSAQPGDQPAPGNQPPPGYPPPGSPPPPGYRPLQPPPGSPQQGYPSSPGYPQQGFQPAAPPPASYGYGQAPPPPTGTQYGPGGTVFDPGSGLYLPQGTQLASHGRRIAAWFLSILLVIVTLVIGYVIWGIIAWTKGTTPALQVLGMKCYLPDGGQVPGFGQMVLREVVGVFLVGLVPFTQLISFILFLATAKRQSLHDMIASTVVLHDPNKVLS